MRPNLSKKKCNKWSLFPHAEFQQNKFCKGTTAQLLRKAGFFNEAHGPKHKVWRAKYLSPTLSPQYGRLNI